MAHLNPKAEFFIGEKRSQLQYKLQCLRFRVLILHLISMWMVFKDTSHGYREDYEWGLSIDTKSCKILLLDKCRCSAVPMWQKLERSDNVCGTGFTSFSFRITERVAGGISSENHFNCANNIQLSIKQADLDQSYFPLWLLLLPISWIRYIAL